MGTTVIRNVGPTAANDFQKVTHGRPAGARDYGNVLWKCWQRSLAITVEKPLGLQLISQLTQLGLQFTFALQLHFSYDQLIRATWRIHVHVTATNDVLAILDVEGESPDIAPPHHAFDRTGFIFQRKVKMATAGPRQIDDLARYPHRMKFAL